MENAMTMNELALTLDALTIYRGLLDDPVLSKLSALIKNTAGGGSLSEVLRGYGDFCKVLCESGFSCNLSAYLADAVLYAENPFTAEAERSGSENLPPLLLKAAAADLRSLQALSEAGPRPIKEYLFALCATPYETELIEALPEWEHERTALLDRENWSECLPALAAFYRKSGAGVFARFTGFVWEGEGPEGRLHGVEAPDPVRLSDLVGYQTERGQVIDNTLQFLRGLPVNNMLLYGDRGTGKSSTVKALLNEYHDLGLRLIEIPVGQLSDLPQIIRKIKNRRNRFILFIDDLAFENSEDRYTALKAVLEGGLENRPQNVVIYATSNRRHLVREKFSDRTGMLGGDEEVHAADAMEEKLSLADRFGITVTFSAPNQEQYLAVVDSLADARGLVADRETLHKEAVRWEMWYNGRSPRTARQFVDWYESKLKMNP